MISQTECAARGAKRDRHLAHELPAIIDALADGFEDSTVVIANESDVRVFLSGGSLVSNLAIYCRLDSEGIVRVIYLDVDR